MKDLQIAQLSDLIWRGGLPRTHLVAGLAPPLRGQIQTGELPRGTKLHSESEFARRLGVSRPTLREAMRILAREGLLDIRHGVGTFVSEPSRHVTSALDTMRSMTALIRAFGGTPGVRDMTVTMVEADHEVAAALKVVKETRLARIARVRLIDDRPLALAYEYVPLRDERAEFSLLKTFDGGSIYAFLTERLDRALIHSEMSATAVSASERQAALLHLKRRSPLLLMREVHFDADGRRIFYSVNYHNTAAVEFTLIRANVRS